MRWRASNHSGAAVAAVIALAVTGCSSAGSSTGSQDTGAAPGSATRSANPAAKPIGTPGTVTVSWCDVNGGPGGAAKTQQLTLASYSVTDGQEVARKVSVLPQGADTGILCDSSPTGQTSVPSALRQAFNKDFTMVAGVLPAAQQPTGGSDGGQAGAFSLTPQGTPVGAPSADPFTPAPKDRTPAFQNGTSTLWYENSDKHVMSRDLTQPAAAASDHGMSHSQGFVLAGDQPWSRMPLHDEFKDVTVNPSGTAAAAGSNFGSAIWLKDSTVPGSGDSYAEPLGFGPSTFGSGGKTLPGGDSVPACLPKFWTDDHTLFCAGKGFSRVVFSESLDSVQKVDQLLPANDRDNSAVAPSPDGKSLIFLSRQGQDTADLYRLDLMPGAAPKKLASIPAHSPRVMSELRLISWQ